MKSRNISNRKSYSDALGIKFLFSNWKVLRYKFTNNIKLATVKYNSFLQIHERVAGISGKSLDQQTVLEIGCGQLLANVKLFSVLCQKVIGVDPELPPQKFFDFMHFIKVCGLQRFLKTILNEILFMSPFDRKLQELGGGEEFNFQNCKLYRMRANKLPIPTGSIDLIISDDVFEHIDDVEAVLVEMERVLRPGGAFCIQIHPFTAFSGGHDLDTVTHLGDSLAQLASKPWRHLYDRAFQDPVFLNRLRRKDYEKVFNSIFSEVNCDALGPEGERYLTPETLQIIESQGFSKDEILIGKLVFSGKKNLRLNVPYV